MGTFALKELDKALGLKPDPRLDYGRWIKEDALEIGVDPDLAARMFGQESNLNPSAVSVKGARGIAQLMPATARYVSQKHNVDTSTPRGNLRGGLYYLKEQLDEFGHDRPDLAVSAYHAGPGSVRAAGGRIPKTHDTLISTAGHVKKVLGYAPQYQSSAPAPAQSALNELDAALGLKTQTQPKSALKELDESLGLTAAPPKPAQPSATSPQAPTVDAITLVREGRQQAAAAGRKIKFREREELRRQGIVVTDTALGDVIHRTGIRPQDVRKAAKEGTLQSLGAETSAKGRFEGSEEELLVRQFELNKAAGDFAAARTIADDLKQRFGYEAGGFGPGEFPYVKPGARKPADQTQAAAEYLQARKGVPLARQRAERVAPIERTETGQIELAPAQQPEWFTREQAEKARLDELRQSVASLTPEQRQRRAEDLMRREKRPLSPAEMEIFQIEPGLISGLWNRLAAGVSGTAGSILETAARTYGALPGPVQTALFPQTLLPGAPTPEQIRETAAQTGAALSEEARIQSQTRGRQGFVGDIAEAAGTSLPFFLAGGLPGRAGQAAAGLLGAAVQADQGYKEALAAGATPEEALRASYAVAPIGLTEMFGIGGALGRAERGQLIRSFVQAVKRESGEEMTQEGIQGVLSDLAAKGLYDPQRELFKQVPYQVLVAAVSGGLFGVAAQGPATIAERLGERRRPQPTLPEAPTAIDAQIQALREGRRGAVLITPGEQLPDTQGFQTTKTKEGTFIHREDLKPADIRKAVQEGTFQSLLGIIEPKPAPGAPAAVVEAKAPETGREIQTAVVSPEAAPVQAEVLAEQHPGAVVETGGPEKAAEVIAEREAERGEPQPVPVGAKPSRKLSHAQFGEVTVADSQAGVAKGKLRVVDAEGNEHIIQNPRSVGNQEAAFIKPVEPAMAPEPTLVEQPTALPMPAGTRPVERGGEVVAETPPTGPAGLPGAVKTLREERRAATRAAETDTLTGLGNRTALDKALPAAEADPNTAVVVFDINELGKVNKIQEYGQAAGDDVIIRAAEAVRQAATEAGVPSRAFRRGGDEIVALIPKDKAEAVRIRAEELMGEQQYSGTHGQTRKQVTANVSLTGAVGDTFKAADAALQPAKGARKAATVTAVPEVAKPAPSQGKIAARRAEERAGVKAEVQAQAITDSASFRAAWEKAAPKITKEQADQLEEVSKAMARGFVLMNPGKTETDFYSQFAGIERGGEVSEESLMQSAWHGSPYKFDKFTLEHIGSGEGAQSYGWGLYFAGNRAVAEFYQQKFGRNRIVVDSDVKPDAAQVAQRALELGVYAQGTKKGDEWIRTHVSGTYPQMRAGVADDAISAIRKKKVRPAAPLYKVDLAPAEDEYLLWDKPLSQQSGKVKAAISSAPGEAGVLLQQWLDKPSGQDMLGRNIYTITGDALSAADRTTGRDTRELDKTFRGRDAQASQYLRSVGIRGIKYLDQGSRGALVISPPGTSGRWIVSDMTGGNRHADFSTEAEAEKYVQNHESYNYVIFDDADIVIQEVFLQQQRAGAAIKGSAEFISDGRALIRAFENADISTALHESAHVARRYLDPDSLKVVEEWVGVKDGDWTGNRAAEEKFARAFERYFYEGKAPSKELQPLFARMMEFIRGIYQSLRGSSIAVKLSPEVESVFARVLGVENVEVATEAAVVPTEVSREAEARLSPAKRREAILKRMQARQAPAAQAPATVATGKPRRAAVRTEQSALFQQEEESKKREFVYRLTLRPASTATVPKGFTRLINDGSKHGAVAYSKPLPRADVEHFDLQPLDPNDPINIKKQATAISEDIDQRSGYGERGFQIENKLYTPDMGRGGDAWRATFFNTEGQPTGHIEYDSYIEARQDAIADTLRENAKREIQQPLFQTSDKILPMKGPEKPGKVEQEEGLPGKEAQPKAAQVIADATKYQPEQGKPVTLRLYHGTGTGAGYKLSEIPAFRAPVYFAEREVDVRHYQARLKNKRVYKVNVRFEKPADMTGISVPGVADVADTELSFGDFDKRTKEIGLSDQEIVDAFNYAAKRRSKEFLETTAITVKDLPRIRATVETLARLRKKAEEARQIASEAWKDASGRTEGEEVFWENQYRLADEAEAASKAYFQAVNAPEAHKQTPYPMKSWFFFGRGGEISPLQASLQKRGYDGVFFYDLSTRKNYRGRKNRTWVAFDPAKIEAIQDQSEPTRAAKMPPSILSQTSEPSTKEGGRVVDTPEFKRWFGDSKVVDEKGTPLVVYHGTPTAGFSEFKQKGTRDAGFLGNGYYFTESTDWAGQFAEAKRKTQKGRVRSAVYPAFLRLENPLDLSTATEGDFRRGIDASRQVQGLEPISDERWAGYAEAIRETQQRDNPLKQTYELSSLLGDISRIAEAAGYDGIIARGVEGNTYIAFAPTQVKSVFNRGTFDPSSPNILYQEAEPPLDQDLIDLGTTYIEEGVNTYDAWKRAITRDLTAYNRPVPDDAMLQRVFKSAQGRTAIEGVRETGIKHAVTTSEREARGLPEIEKAVHKSFGQMLDEGIDLINRGEIHPRSFAELMARQPRALTAAEDAALIYDRMRLHNEHHAVLKELETALDESNQEKVLQHQAELARIETQIAVNDEAARRTGTETGRGLAARRMMIKRDYSLAAVIQKAKAAGEGKISPALRERLTELTKQLEDTESKLIQAQERIAQLESQDNFRRAQREVRKKPSRTKPVLETEFTSLRNQLARLMGKTESEEGPFFQEEELPEGRPLPAGGLDRSVTRILGQMAVNAVERGARSHEAVVDEVYDAVKDLLPDIAKREVRDAISGYGVTTQLSKDELAVQMRELKRQMRLISSLEDAQAGESPLRSGLQRDKPSQQVRALTRAVSREIRRQGLNPERQVHPEEKWKTTEDALRTRLRNEIEDLDKQVGTGEVPQPKEQLRKAYSDETIALMAERDLLRKQVQDPTLKNKSDLLKRIAEAEKKLREGDTQSATSNKFPPEIYDDAEARDLRKQLKGLQANLTAIRNQPREQERLRTQIADLQRRIRERDFTRASREARQVDPVTAELRTQRDELRKALRELEGPRTLTPEQRVRAAEQSLERTITAIEAQIAKGDTSARKPTVGAWSPRISELQKRRNELAKRMKALRDAAKTPEDINAARLAAFKTRVANQIADLERRLREGDFIPTKRAKTQLDTDAERLATRRDILKRQIEAEIRKQAPGRLPRTIAGLWKAGLLSRPATHLRNITSNAMYQVFDETARIPGVIADYAVSTVTGQRSLQGPSPSGMLDAVVGAATKGRKEAAEIILHGQTREQAEKMQFPQEVSSGIKIIDLAANQVFRFMSAEDRVFYNAALARNLRDRAAMQAKNERRTDKNVDISQRIKDLTGKPSPELLADAQHDALIVTFNNNNALSDAMRRARSRFSPTTNMALDFIVPFDRTPTNILSRVLEASPAGFVKAGVQAAGALRRFRKETKAPDSKRTAREIIQAAMTQEQQRQFVQTIGRATTGTAVMYLGYVLASAGLATGPPDDDLAKRERDKAAGRKPMAIRLPNGNWHVIGLLSPLGDLIGIGAGLWRETHDVDEKKPISSAVGMAGKQIIGNAPLARGMEEWTELIREPGRRASAFLGRFAGSVIPGVLADAANILDTSEREINKESISSAVKETIQSRVPGWRQMLPEAKDVFGRPLEHRRANVVVPVATSTARENFDPVDREMVRLDIPIGRQPRKDGESMEEYRRRTEIVGRRVYEALNNRIKTDIYRRDVPTGQRDGLRDAIKRARAEAARELKKTGRLRLNP